MTEKTIMQGTNRDPQFLAFVTITVVQANADNVDKLVGDDEHYKERMINMKDTLVKERGEGRELNRKHEATISKKESIQKEHQYLETNKGALELLVTIMEGEKKDLEDKILEL